MSCFLGISVSWNFFLQNESKLSLRFHISEKLLSQVNVAWRTIRDDSLWCIYWFNFSFAMLLSRLSIEIRWWNAHFWKYFSGCKFPFLIFLNSFYVFEIIEQECLLGFQSNPYRFWPSGTILLTFEWHLEISHFKRYQHVFLRRSVLLQQISLLCTYYVVCS